MTLDQVLVGFYT